MQTRKSPVKKLDFVDSVQLDPSQVQFRKPRTLSTPRGMAARSYSPGLARHVSSLRKLRRKKK